MGYRYFPCLVPALLSIRYLVFNLDGASTRFDHALGQQVGGFFVTKTRIYVGDDRHHVGFVVVDALNNAVCVAAVGAGFI